MLDGASDENANNSVVSQGVKRAAIRALTLLELVQCVDLLQKQRQGAHAVELYKTWIAFNARHDHLYIAYYNLAALLKETGDIPGAINAFRECLRVNPRFEPARINLGRTLEDSGNSDLAVAEWEESIAATPTTTAESVGYKLMALQNIGRVLEDSEAPERAEQALLQAMELRPDKTEAGQHWISLRQKQCKWPVLIESQYVTSQQLAAAISPLTLAALADDPMFQLGKAFRYNRSWVGCPDGAPFRLPPKKTRTDWPRRVRVGYVSSDFREHAVGFALCEVLEFHDRSKFEIFAYYSGRTSLNDDTQRRIKTAVEHWREIDGITDVDVAKQIVNDQIDILVDLNGYTKSARTRIFAYRPAPVIVNWCGYPGTMGSPYHNYIIADPQIIPPDKQVYYSEGVLYIPCNQPIDRKRNVAPRTATRADVGLADDVFVYACFNGMQKVTHACYQRWMSILAATPAAVLWLLTGDQATNARLAATAADNGIDPKRIIFAQKAVNPQHLARLHLADLFLDTFPYGAHSTGADALTMTLPVLTMPGKTFASRFCSSVVRAAGVGDLVCATPEQYVDRAIELSRSPNEMTNYRNTLQQARLDSVLFDIPGTVRRLEDIYFEINDADEKGLTPVPDLTNLDIYYEIGAELLSQNMEFSSEECYRSRYIERLASRDRHQKIARDHRLWRTSDARAT